MMKSCLLEHPAETQLDLRCLPINSLLEDNYFATVPMPAIPQKHVPRIEDEEKLYTSFEEAISERVARVSRHLNSRPLAAEDNPRATIAPTVASPFCGARLWRAWRARRRAITLFCLALSLFMAGFDLLGLLIISR